MLRARLFDGGTRSTHPGTDVPNAERLRYIAVNYERELHPGDFERYLTCTNPVLAHRHLCNQPEVPVPFNTSMEPWPFGMPYMMWLDRTERYEGDRNGFVIELHHEDLVRPQKFAPVPAGRSELHHQPPERLDPTGPREDMGIIRSLTWQETRARVVTSPPPVRLPTDNEERVGDGPFAGTGGTELREPMVLNLRGARGASYIPVVPDNPLFAPFDLTHPERYRAFAQDGTELEGEPWRLLEGGIYNLYLRPRTWRFFATVLCHFLYIAWFEMVPNDELFLKISFNRPAIYPWRHDLLGTAGTQTVQDFFGDWHAYDHGIDWQWTHSRAQSSLSTEIFQQQWYTLCIVYIFLGNEDPWIEIESWPPKPREAVLAIGRWDERTRKESLVYVVQQENLDHVYPRTSHGSWLVRWRLPSGGLF